jgi:hypothetical protein
MSEEHTFSLVLAFDSDDPEFARGCEVGTVWEALRHTDPWDSHSATVYGSNAEMMLRIAEATGRPLTTHDSDPDWISVLFGPAKEPT